MSFVLEKPGHCVLILWVFSAAQGCRSALNEGLDQSRWEEKGAGSTTEWKPFPFLSLREGIIEECGI